MKTSTLLSVLISSSLTSTTLVFAQEVSGIVEVCGGCDGVCSYSHDLYDPCSASSSPVPLDASGLVEGNCGYFDLEVSQCFSTPNPWFYAYEAVEKTVPCTYLRGLRITGKTDAVLVLPRGARCANSYDVIRGQLPLAAGGSLGLVTCLANDAQGLTLPESSTPSVGEAFFYLVRMNGRPYGAHYGLASDGAQRLPLAGDCAP